MSGFIIKDILVMKNTLRYYLFLMAVYGLLAVMGVFPYSIIAGFIVLVGMMTPISTFAYDEQARWDKYAAATPAGRRGVVKSKYAFTLLLLAVASLFTLVILEALWFLGKEDIGSWAEPLMVVGVMNCISLLIASVTLPVMFKYGSEKSRVISMVIFVGVFGSVALLAFLAEKGINFSAMGAAVASLSPWIIAAALLLVTVAVTLLSYRLSLRIYTKREL